MFAVIFTRRMSDDLEGYDAMAVRMLELAEQQDGFIAFNSMGDKNLGVAISYWKDLNSIKAWKQNIEHLEAQRLGRSKFYRDFSLQICRVEKSYCFGDPDYHPILS